MTPKVRRALLWSGLFLLVFAGGSILGRFTVAGLAGDRAFPGMTDAADFWQQQDRARDSQGTTPAAPVQHFVAGIPEAHDCENCDASVARDRQTAQYIASQYPSLMGDGEAAASPPVSPPPPSVPSAP